MRVSAGAQQYAGVIGRDQPHVLPRGTVRLQRRRFLDDFIILPLPSGGMVLLVSGNTLVHNPWIPSPSWA